MKSQSKKKLAWAALGLGMLGSVGWAASGVEGLAIGENSDDQSVQLEPLANLSPDVERAIDSANGLSMAFRTVAKRMLPTLVAIENRPAVAMTSPMGIRPSQGGIPGDNPFKGTPFEELFKGRDFQMVPPGGMQPRTRPQGGIGSGVIIDPSGVILTNNHVVEGGGEVTVKTSDGREFIASQVWTDPKTDLAVVKIENATNLVSAPLGDSDQVEIGDWVIALGQPFGLESTVTAGIISAKNRGIGITARESFLQTDAAINPGNSGGPLVNLRGEVIGINTAISSRTGGSDGIGFAVPSNLARWVSDQLVSDGTVRRAYLGVGIQPVTAELATQLGVAPRSGVAVTEVLVSSPAAQAGLKTGDVITQFDGRDVATPQQLQLAVERAEFGKMLTIDLVRDGKPMKLQFKAQEQPSDFSGNRESSNGKPSASLENLGLEIAPLDRAVAEQLGLSSTDGVIITGVKSGSAAERTGLEAGMVISQVNRQNVKSIDQVVAAIKADRENGSGTLLLIKTENGSRFLVLK